jgi:predicted PurR-regulated permease PerM
MSKTNTIDRWTKSALFVALILLLFYFGGNILFPILFAGFIALALSGFARKMDKWGVNRFISAFLLTVLLSSVFIGIIAFLSMEGVHVADEIKAMSGSKTLDTAVSIFEMAKEKLELSSSAEDPISSWTGSLISSSGEVISTLIGGLQSTVVFFSLVPIYIFFILAYRKVFTRFLEASSVNKTEETGKKIVEEISDMLRKYVNGLFIVILIVAVLNTVGLWIIGVDHPLFFGTATALLMIIPYIGVFIGSVVPAAIALITLLLQLLVLL